MQNPDSRGGIPDVQIIQGKVVLAPGVDPGALVWLPRNGQVIAKLPVMRGNLGWLKKSVRVRSPRQLKDHRWELPRNCLTKLVTAAVDRYGHVVVLRDMSKLSRCTRACLEAAGADCDCSCLGLHHGQDSDSWFERVGDVAVAELGEFTRTAILYVNRRIGDGAELYEGQLHHRKYRTDRSGRSDWPRASRFMCAGCLSRPAKVWDHCHRHGFVRAPLCNTCNTRHWGGWDPAQGRPTPSSNLDTSYYGWCPGFDDTWGGFCSP